MDIPQILSQVCQLAVSVGSFQLQQRRTFDPACIVTKKAHDYVSYVDKESEQMIVEGLRHILPEAEFITEEKTTEQTAHDAQYVWIVDPLDGTTNFIHDICPWCVSIALRDIHGLLIGVVYEPVRGELFYASRGQGAWLRLADGSKRRLSVSNVSDIDQALVMVGFPYEADKFRGFVADMTAALYGHCISLRSMGSAEVELCYVAAARIDAYFESYLQPWDVSAGALIVMEAGGRVSDYHDSERLWPSGRQMLATNGLIHRQMLDIMADKQSDGDDC